MQQRKRYEGDFAFSATQSDVEAAFSRNGDSDEVRVESIRDTVRPSGSADVTIVRARRPAETASGASGRLLDGRNLIVNIAAAKTGDGRGGRRDRLGTVPFPVALEPASNVTWKIANRLCI